MKKLVIIAFIILSGIKLNAQTFNAYADTANYLLNQIQGKKSQYIGKPFSVLYDSLKIKPVEILPIYDTKKENFAKGFYWDFNYEQDFSKEHFIVVIFDTPPTYDVVYPMLYPLNQRAPIGDIINLYKPLIVKDIIVKDYSEDDTVDPNILQMP